MIAPPTPRPPRPATPRPARTPAGADAVDGGLWLSSILIGAAFAAVAVAYVFALPALLGQPGWYQPLDLWQQVRGGSFVAAGALPWVYQGTSSYALPLGFIAMAPASALVDHLHLVESYPFPVPRPTALVVVVPYCSSFGVLALHALRRLAWQLGARRRLWRLQVLGAVVILAPCYYWGHPEDVLAVAFSLYALRRALTCSPVAAGWYLSLAIASKQWALLLVPFLVALAPPGRRMRTLAAAGALPGAFSALVLGCDWHDAFPALFEPVNAGSTTLGHLSFYAGWFGSRTSQYSRSAGMALALPAGWMLRRWKSGAALAGAGAVLLLIRPLAEAISFSYYWSPGLALAGLCGLAAHREVRVRDWLLPVAVVAWATPQGHASTSAAWWAVQAVLLAGVAVQVALAVRAGPRAHPAGQGSVKNGVDVPILTAVRNPAGGRT